MRIRHLGCIAALAALSLPPALAAAKCQLQQIGVMPVYMQGAPLVWTKINGVKARFLLDTGSFYSSISRDAAAQYQLPVTSVPGADFSIRGLGGDEKPQLATVGAFEYLGVQIPKVRFLTIEENFPNAAGLIGQNLLHVSDVEYDLANGIVRFIKPVGCEGQPLAYWAVSTPYAYVELNRTDAARSHLSATARINGHSVGVIFDTGASRSYLSQQAAARAGIAPYSPGVKFLGLTSGIGPRTTKVWVAPVDNFQLGAEKVEHTHLLIADLRMQDPVGAVSNYDIEMLLGQDFFLSHRIYVANSQGRLYFTYNGGPLFNLDLPQDHSGATKPPPTSADASLAHEAAREQQSSDAPTDADGFMRRGLAYASMREFDRALADLTRACDLAPRDAQTHFDRGVIYAQDGQLKSALQDYTAAITLQPDDIDALLARAELLQSHPDAGPTSAAAQVKSDLDAVSRLAPPAAAVRLTLGHLYGKLGDYASAVGQVDRWLSEHPLEPDQATGLNSRCWLRATQNRDLPQALKDCNRALDLRPLATADIGSSIPEGGLVPDNPQILDSRGLVYLRLGNPTDAVRDYDSALRADPNMATALYGRGLAELRLGEKAQGQDDLAAAAKLDSGIAPRFANMGLTP